MLVAGSIERALQVGGEGRVLAGEVECEKAPGFDLGNSPEEMLGPRGAELVLATTNGAPAIVAAAAASDEVIVASLLNLDAVVRTLAGSRGDVLLVCAGRNGNITLEDVYLAGRISAALEGERTDAARIAEAAAASFPNAIDALEASSGAVGIHAAGLSSDIAFCAQESITTVDRAWSGCSRTSRCWKLKTATPARQNMARPVSAQTVGTTGTHSLAPIQTRLSLAFYLWIAEVL